MTTLISLIGKSKADPQTGYRKAHYSFEPNFSRTLIKRGGSDGPLGLAEAWTTGQELNRAVANQPKFEIASGAANAKIEVGPHSFAFQRPNT